MDDNKALTFSGIVLSIFLMGVFLRLAKSVLIPFVLALFFYFILSPVLDFMTRLKIPKVLAVVVILLITFFVLYLLGVMFYSSGKSFAAEFPKYGQKFSSMLRSLLSGFKLPNVKWDPLAWVDSLDISQVGSLLLSSLGTFFSFFANLFLILIFLIFMLAGRGKLNIKIKNSLSPHRSSQLVKIIEHIDREIQKYLAIKTVICLASGIFTTVVLLIFGVDFAIALGFITFLLNYIPNIGAFIAKILPFFIALVQFEHFWPAFWILVILTVFDAIVSMVIEPRIMGHGLGLSPLFILFALFFWGWLWGIPGMILAVPLMAILKIISHNFPSLKFLEALMSK